MTNTELSQTIGKCLSLDNTFHSASKASIVDNKHNRTKIMKGGLLSVINEWNEILSWVRTLPFDVLES
jgi:hypothetical protein